MRFHSLNAILLLVAGSFLLLLALISGPSFVIVVRAEETTSATTKEEAAVKTEAEGEDDVVYKPPANAEKYGFQAEVHRMLDIVVNSLYQHKDVFLRELISNASDALDKIRYLTLTQPDKYNNGDDDDIELKVEIEYDDVAKTVTIRDTGVGMTHDEMVTNLGTVARSGTTKFMEAMKESGNVDATISQIGQFGVGFYSTFLVADRVAVTSKSPLDSKQYVWESNNGASEFFIYEDPKGNTLQRGTEITLHLKEDEQHYASQYELKKLAKHYSEFVVHPISVRVTETIMVDDDDDDADTAEEKKANDDDLEVKDDDDDDKDKPTEKPKQQKPVTTHSWEVVNGDPAIWTREKDTVTPEEYQNFYKLLAGNENANAAEWSHFNAEGNINFKSILYLPDDLPPNYKQGSMDPIRGAVKLYVRKVLIGDEFDFLPKYLGFIRGVVDSDELTLNVNRETLQEEKTLKIIRKKVVKKAIDLIRQFAKESDAEVQQKDKKDEDEEVDDEEKKDEDTDKKKGDETQQSKYIDWYRKFSPNIKLGIIDDYPNRDKLIKLLRFETSKSNGTLISVEEYSKGMKDWQKEIYVLGCVNVAECSASPFLEVFRDKDVEVIYMTDAIDEYLVKNVMDINKKKIVQISNENVKLNDEDPDMMKRREKIYRAKFKPLTDWLKKLYQNNVLRVQVAKRPLGSVPAIVTSSEYGNSANMERIMKAQAYQFGVDPHQIMSMKVFELNPRHPLILKLLDGCPSGDTKEEDIPHSVTDAAWMLLDMAMLNGGFGIHDPEKHNKRMAKVLQDLFSLDSLNLEPEIHPPVEEDEPPEVDGGHDDVDMDDLDDMPPMDMNNLDLDALRDQFPDAGWPDKDKKKSKPKKDEANDEL